MNKITLPVSELKAAFSGLSKIISKRAVLPVLQHARVERLSDGALTISATDLEAFYFVPVRARRRRKSRVHPRALYSSAFDRQRLCREREHRT